MADIFGRIKQHIGKVILLGAFLTAAVGCIAFFLAFRPCAVQLSEGDMFTYTVRTEETVLLSVPRDEGGVVVERGKTRVSEEEVVLLCVGPNNEVVMVGQRADGGFGDQIQHLRIDKRGKVQSAGPAQQTSNGLSGPQTGVSAKSVVGRFFDFNLLPLPESIEQEWTVPITYGALPAPQNVVDARVKRVENGLHPLFEMKIDSVEWVEDRSRRTEHYNRLADARCRYRYNSRQNLVSEADFFCRYAQENPYSKEYDEIEVAVQMRLREWKQNERPEIISDLALASVRVQQGGIHAEQQRKLIRHLVSQAESAPRLQALARRLAGMEAGSNSTTGRLQRAAAQEGWAVQVASVPRARRPRAQQVVDGLREEGYQAWLREKGQYVTICVGPWAQKNKSAMHKLQQKFASQQPFWIKVNVR